MEVIRTQSGATKAADDDRNDCGSGQVRGESVGTVPQANRILAYRDLGAWIFADVVVNGHQQAAYAALVAAEEDGRLYIYDDAPPWQAWRVCELAQGGARGEGKARCLTLRLWASEWEEATYRANWVAADAADARN